MIGVVIILKFLNKWKCCKIFFTPGMSCKDISLIHFIAKYTQNSLFSVILGVSLDKLK
jgi:hypothetical protein